MIYRGCCSKKMTGSLTSGTCLNSLVASDETPIELATAGRSQSMLGVDAEFWNCLENAHRRISRSPWFSTCYPCNIMLTKPSKTTDEALPHGRMLTTEEDRKMKENLARKNVGLSLDEFTLA